MLRARRPRRNRHSRHNSRSPISTMQRRILAAASLTGTSAPPTSGRRQEESAATTRDCRLGARRPRSTRISSAPSATRARLRDTTRPAACLIVSSRCGEGKRPAVTRLSTRTRAPRIVGTCRVPFGRHARSARASYYQGGATRDQQAGTEAQRVPRSCLL